MTGTDIVHATVRLFGSPKQYVHPNTVEFVERNVAKPLHNQTCSYCKKVGRFPHTLFMVLGNFGTDTPRKMIKIVACSGCVNKASQAWDKYTHRLPGELFVNISATKHIKRSLKQEGFPV